MSYMLSPGAPSRWRARSSASPSRKSGTSSRGTTTTSWSRTRRNCPAPEFVQTVYCCNAGSSVGEKSLECYLNKSRTFSLAKPEWVFLTCRKFNDLFTDKAPTCSMLESDPLKSIFSVCGLAAELRLQGKKKNKDYINQKNKNKKK